MVELGRKIFIFLEKNKQYVCLAVSVESVPLFDTVKRPLELGVPANKTEELTVVASSTNFAHTSSFKPTPAAA